jgi:hypothetical protein
MSGIPLQPDDVLNMIEAAFKWAPIREIAESVSVLAATMDVKLVPGRSVFSVSDANGHVNIVRLFPSETCTCPATLTYCHILGAKASTGVDTAA